MHNKTHTMTGGDHTAGNWKLFYTDGSGNVIELALPAAGGVLYSNGTAAAPSFGMQNYGVQAVTATTSTTNIDLSTGTSFDITLQASTAINFTNPPASGMECHVPIRIIQDSTGGRAITWAISGTAKTPKYEGGTAPTLTGTASSVDKLHVVVRNSELEVYVVAKDLK